MTELHGEKWGAQHPGTDRSVEGGVYGAVTFGLQGRARLIEQEQDEVLEGELASAGKVLRILAVGGDEGGTIERTGYFLYNFQTRAWLAVSSDAV